MAFIATYEYTIVEVGNFMLALNCEDILRREDSAETLLCCGTFLSAGAGALVVLHLARSCGHLPAAVHVADHW